MSEHNLLKCNEEKNMENINEVVDNMIQLKNFDVQTISKILKSNDKNCNEISLLYLKKLNFEKMPILDAYRKLNTLIFINGDVQEIDNIHLRFSQVYVEQNPETFSKVLDQVYILVTSFSILSKDLHRKSSHQKMSIKQYIKGLNMTDYSYDDNLLSIIYKSIKSQEIKGPLLEKPKKRTSKNDPNSVVYNKKIKSGTEIIKIFDRQSLMKKSVNSGIFDTKSWKPYMCMIIDRMIHLYPLVDYKQFDSLPENEKTFVKLKQIVQHVDLISIIHAYSIVDTKKPEKAILFLVDDTKHVFNFCDKDTSERWTYRMNLAAGLLSAIPMKKSQINVEERVILRTYWSTETSKLPYSEQRKLTEETKLEIENDINYLKKLQKLSKDQKEILKQSEKSLLKYQCYCRALRMFDEHNAYSMAFVDSVMEGLGADMKDLQAYSSELSCVSNYKSSTSQPPSDISNIITRSRNASSSFQ